MTRIQTEAITRDEWDSLDVTVAVKMVTVLALLQRSARLSCLGGPRRGTLKARQMGAEVLADAGRL